MEQLPLWSILCAGLFAGIMLTTILISALPKITIRLLEGCKLFPKNSLQFDKRNYVDGAGRYVYRGVYLRYINGREQFENMQVFLRTLLICLPTGMLIVYCAFRFA